jgi:hypothetical protein
LKRSTRGKGEENEYSFQRGRWADLLLRLLLRLRTCGGRECDREEWELNQSRWNTRKKSGKARSLRKIMREFAFCCIETAAFAPVATRTKLAHGFLEWKRGKKKVERIERRKKKRNKEMKRKGRKANLQKFRKESLREREIQKVEDLPLAICRVLCRFSLLPSVYEKWISERS